MPEDIIVLGGLSDDHLIEDILEEGSFVSAAKSYLIFTDIKEAEAYQAKVDAELGYPEDINSLTYVGGGIHAPKELGLALHFSYPVANDKKDSWFLLKQDETTAVYTSSLPDKIVKKKIVPVPAKATEVAVLPKDWKDPIVELGP